MDERTNKFLLRDVRTEAEGQTNGQKSFLTEMAPDEYAIYSAKCQDCHLTRFLDALDLITITTEKKTNQNAT